MPIELRDLAPFLTPYHAPQSLDLSGVATLIAHNRDRDESARVADQNNATNLAHLAETSRHDQATEEAVRAAAALAEANRQHEEKMKAIAASGAAIDPNKQGQVEALIRGAGFGFSDYRPPGEVSSGPVSAPVPTAAAAAPAQPAMSKQDSAALLPGVSAPGLPASGPIPNMQAPIGEAEQKDLNSFIDQAAPDTHRYVTQDDNRVMTWDMDARRRAVEQQVTEQFKQRLATSGEIDSPAAQQALAELPATLQRSGYDANAAAKALDVNYNKLSAQLHSDERSRNQGLLMQQRLGTSNDAKYEQEVNRRVTAIKAGTTYSKLVQNLQATDQADKLMSSANPIEQREAFSATLKQLFPGAISDSERGFLLNAGGALSRAERVVNEYLNGGQLPDDYRDLFIEAAREQRAGLLKQRNAMGKQAFDSVMHSRFFPGEYRKAYADRAFGDITGHYGEDDVGEPSISGAGGSETLKVTSKGARIQKVNEVPTPEPPLPAGEWVIK